MVLRTITEGQTELISYEIVKIDSENVDILKITLLSSFDLESGDEVKLYSSGGIYLFGGYIEKYKLNQQQGIKLIEVYDYSAILTRVNITQVYNNTKLEDIIEDVVINNSSLIFNTNIDTGSAPSVAFVYRDKRAWDIVIELAGIIGANIRVDKNKNFYLEREGENNSNQTLTNIRESINAIQEGEWEEDTSTIVNVITIRGSEQVYEERETYSGGSISEYVLIYTPINVKVESAGVVLKGYIEGVSTGDYKVDKANKKIIFTTPKSDFNVEYTYA